MQRHKVKGCALPLAVTTCQPSGLEMAAQQVVAVVACTIATRLRQRCLWLFSGLLCRCMLRRLAVLPSMCVCARLGRTRLCLYAALERVVAILARRQVKRWCTCCLGSGCQGRLVRVVHIPSALQRLCLQPGSSALICH